MHSHIPSCIHFSPCTGCPINIHPPLHRPNYNFLRQSVDIILENIYLSFSVLNFRPLTLFNAYYSLILFSRHIAKLQAKIHVFERIILKYLFKFLCAKFQTSATLFNVFYTSTLFSRHIAKLQAKIHVF